MGMTAADLRRMGPEAQRQVMKKLGIMGKAKAPKYHNQPDSRGSLRFDSKKEARRYDELMLMMASGKIKDLRLQQDFTLVEAYTRPSGERVRAMRYRADFTYTREGERIVEDVKGIKTKDYQMKKKLMMDKYGISITEI